MTKIKAFEPRSPGRIDSLTEIKDGGFDSRLYVGVELPHTQKP
jgi:hypothetical protein